MSSLAENLYELPDELDSSWRSYQEQQPRYLRVVDDAEDEVETALDEPRPPRVLLAEDDEEMRALLTEELRDAGYQVFPVPDGKGLFRCLKSQRSVCPLPDLVVSDIRMPGLSGMEVLRSLRKSDWTMPVIMITAFGDKQTHDEARELGAATVLDKPFDVEELVHAARSIVPVEV